MFRVFRGFFRISSAGSGTARFAAATLAGGSPKVVELGRGFLFTTFPRDSSSLAWMDSRNGMVHWIARTQPVVNMFVFGDDLLLLDPKGNLAAYALKEVLPSAVRRLLH